MVARDGGAVVKAHPAARLDIRGATFGDLKATRPLRATQCGIEWECECLACGDVVVRSTAQLRYRQSLGYNQSCARCARELRAGIRALAADHARAYYARLWEQTGSLYQHGADELPQAAMCPAKTFDAQDASIERQERESKQAIAAMYPIRSEGGWRCVDCRSVFTAGLGCVLCVEPVCRQCVLDERHVCEADAMSFPEIGRQLGVCAQRAMQIFNSGMRRVRHYIADNWRDFGLSKDEARVLKGRH